MFWSKPSSDVIFSIILQKKISKLNIQSSKHKTRHNHNVEKSKLFHSLNIRNGKSIFVSWTQKFRKAFYVLHWVFHFKLCCHSERRLMKRATRIHKFQVNYRKSWKLIQHFFYFFSVPISFVSIFRLNLGWLA